MAAITTIHPIGLYYIESSGIVDVFNTLLKSYRTSNQFLNLHPFRDRFLMDILNTVIENAFFSPSSSIDLEVDRQRLNMYYRLFGLKIKGKEGLLITSEYNREFENLFKEIMINIFQGIHDRNDPLRVEMSDVVRLPQLLNNLRRNLDDHNTNDVLLHFDEWSLGFQILIDLIEDPNSHLLRALNIISNSLNTRASQLGLKIGVPVNNFESYLEMSRSMSIFLSEIETTNWDEQSARGLYARQEFFRRISDAWLVIDPETNFSRMALENRSALEKNR